MQNVVLDRKDRLRPDSVPLKRRGQGAKVSDSMRRPPEHSSTRGFLRATRSTFSHSPCPAWRAGMRDARGQAGPRHAAARHAGANRAAEPASVCREAPLSDLSPCSLTNTAGRAVSSTHLHILRGPDVCSAPLKPLSLFRILTSTRPFISAYQVVRSLSIKRQHPPKMKYLRINLTTYV